MTLSTPALGHAFATEVVQQYVLLAKHRGHAGPNRSVWKVSVSTEVGCFVEAWQEAWRSSCRELWGHLRSNSRLKPLGLNVHGQDLWFGKFVRDSDASPWHGYPADYRRNAQDRPPTSVLRQWRDQGILAKHQIAKIARGQRCKL